MQRSKHQLRGPFTAALDNENDCSSLEGYADTTLPSTNLPGSDLSISSFDSALSTTSSIDSSSSSSSRSKYLQQLSSGCESDRYSPTATINLDIEHFVFMDDEDLMKVSKQEALRMHMHPYISYITSNVDDPQLPPPPILSAIIRNSKRRWSNPLRS